MSAALEAARDQATENCSAAARHLANSVEAAVRLGLREIDAITIVHTQKYREARRAEFTAWASWEAAVKKPAEVLDPVPSITDGGAEA